MINNNKVYQHWIDCLSNNNPDYNAHKALAKETISKYNKWELKEICIDKILNYKDSILENDYFFKQKVNVILKEFKMDKTPPIILVPLDRDNQKAFLQHKYNDLYLEWEVADGYHRLSAFIKNNYKKVKAYIPRS